MTRVGRIAVLAAVFLSACSSSGSGGTHSGGSLTATSNPSSAVANKTGASASGKVTFTVQVDLTGGAPLAGSFTDTETGSGFGSCAQYASMTGLGWYSPSAQNTEVAGKHLQLLLDVSRDAFHGPGTYKATLVGGVDVGDAPNDQSYYEGTASVTLNADGSGHGSLTNLQPLSVAASGTESGTITWTCSG
jgi:hypothetical protein